MCPSSMSRSYKYISAEVLRFRKMFKFSLKWSKKRVIGLLRDWQGIVLIPLHPSLEQLNSVALFWFTLHLLKLYKEN